MIKGFINTKGDDTWGGGSNINLPIGLHPNVSGEKPYKIHQYDLFGDKLFSTTTSSGYRTTWMQPKDSWHERISPQQGGYFFKYAQENDPKHIAKNQAMRVNPESNDMLLVSMKFPQKKDISDPTTFAFEILNIVRLFGLEKATRVLNHIEGSNKFQLQPLIDQRDAKTFTGQIPNPDDSSPKLSVTGLHFLQLDTSDGGSLEESLQKDGDYKRQKVVE